MRKLALVLFAAILLPLLACTPVVGPAGRDGRDSPTDNAWVVNGAWETIDSRAVDLDSPTATYPLEIIRDQYNGGRIDDLARLYIGALPDIAKAPPARLVIIETRLNRVRRDTTVPRSMLAETRRQLRAGLKPDEALYVDREPPAPLPDPDPWTIYAANCRGKILYKDDASYWKEGGWPSREYLRANQEAGFRDMVARHQNPAIDGEPWRFIEDIVYIEPPGAY